MMLCAMFCLGFFKVAGSHLVLRTPCLSKLRDARQPNLYGRERKESIWFVACLQVLPNRVLTGVHPVLVLDEIEIALGRHALNVQQICETLK